MTATMCMCCDVWTAQVVRNNHINDAFSWAGEIWSDFFARLNQNSRFVPFTTFTHEHSLSVSGHNCTQLERWWPPAAPFIFRKFCPHFTFALIISKVPHHRPSPIADSAYSATLWCSWRHSLCHSKDALRTDFCGENAKFFVPHVSSKTFEYLLIFSYYYYIKWVTTRRRVEHWQCIVGTISIHLILCRQTAKTPTVNCQATHTQTHTYIGG